MKRLIPSRLVTIRQYGAYGHEVGDRPSVWEDDRHLLLDSGVEAYVKTDREYGIALMVPESQVAVANKVLRESPNLFPPQTVPGCPRCRAKDPLARPPYGLAIAAVGFAMAVATVFFEHVGLASLMVLVTVVTAAAIESRLPKWTCRSCGARYTTEAGRRFDD